jgi:hypothetical protein
MACALKRRSDQLRASRVSIESIREDAVHVERGDADARLRTNRVERATHIQRVGAVECEHPDTANLQWIPGWICATAARARELRQAMARLAPMLSKSPAAKTEPAASTAMVDIVGKKNGLGLFSEGDGFQSGSASPLPTTEIFAMRLRVWLPMLLK